MLSNISENMTIALSRPNVNLKYLVKLAVQTKGGSPSTANIYLSGETINFSDGVLARGLIQNWGGLPSYGINPFDKSFIIGGLDLAIINTPSIGTATGMRRISDYLSAYNYEGRDAVLYLYADGISALSDCLPIFIGIIDNLSGDDLIANLTISDASKKLIAPVSGTEISLNNFPSANLVRSNEKYIPKVYGNLAVDLDGRGRLVEGIYLGNGKFAFGDEPLSAVNEVWLYDSDFGRFARLTNSSQYTVTLNDTITGKTVVRLNTYSNIELEAFLYPNKATVTHNDSPLRNVLEEDLEKAIDTDPDTYLPITAPSYVPDGHVDQEVEDIIAFELPSHNAVGTLNGCWLEVRCENHTENAARLVSIGARFDYPMKLVEEEGALGDPDAVDTYEIWGSVLSGSSFWSETLNNANWSSYDTNIYRYSYSTHTNLLHMKKDGVRQSRKDSVANLSSEGDWFYNATTHYLYIYHSGGSPSSVYVIDGGNPLEGVHLLNLPIETTTDASGDYSVTVPKGWTGLVRPTLSGYAFSPRSFFISDIAANSENNFSGSAVDQQRNLGYMNIWATFLSSWLGLDIFNSDPNLIDAAYTLQDLKSPCFLRVNVTTNYTSGTGDYPIEDIYGVRLRVRYKRDFYDEATATRSGNIPLSSPFYNSTHLGKGFFNNSTALYVECEGKTFGSWIDADGRSTSFDEDDLITNPAYIIESILRDILGFDDINTASFDDAASEMSTWDLVAVIRDKQDGLSLIQDICKQTKSVFYINAAGEACLFTFKSSYTPVGTIYPKDILSGTFRFDKTDFSSLVNSASVDFLYDESAKKTSRTITQENTTSQSEYLKVAAKEIKAPNIAQKATAQLLIDHFVGASGFWKDRHPVATFTGALWLMKYDIGDVIYLDKTFDDIVSNFGDTWEETAMLITNKKLNRNGIDFELLALE